MNDTPTTLDVVASLRIEDGRRWGETAHQFQWDDVRALLDSMIRRHFWLRARGMDKTGSAAAVGLGLLITEAPERSRSYVYAADADQAALLLDSIVGFVERTGLSDLVDITGRTITCRATGATLSIESSDSASAFGLRPWLVIVDEVAQWPDTRGHAKLWGAIVSSIGKVSGARLLVMSSAGSPSHPALKRWQVAESSEHWRASLNVGPCPWWSPVDIDAAAEQLTPTEFDRYIRCEWAEGDDSLATLDDVLACTGTYRVREPVRGTRYVMSLDIGTKRDSTVLGVAHLEAGPVGRRVVVDRTWRWTGTRLHPVSLSEVEEALLAAWHLYGRPRLVYDPYAAQQLTERLTRAGVSAEEFIFSTSGVNKLARSLYGALRDRAILLPADEILTTELSKVRLVETGPGLVRLDHRSGEHDDQAVVCAMLCATLLDQPGGVLRIQVATGHIPTSPVEPSNPRSGFFRKMRVEGEPIPTIKPGAVRPVERLVRFSEAKKHPRYKGPQ